MKNFLNKKLWALVDYAYHSEFDNSEWREKAEAKFASLSEEDKEIAEAILDASIYGNAPYNAGHDAYVDAKILASTWK